MKLKKGVVVCDVGGNPMVICSGEALDLLNGLIHNNKTGDFIFRQLQQETTQEKIVDSMLETFDAPREVIAADAAEFVAEIRKLGLLDE